MCTSTNVYIDDDDDCISIKSGKDADGLRVNRPAEDILIENSHFAYGQAPAWPWAARPPAASATSQSRTA